MSGTPTAGNGLELHLPENINAGVPHIAKSNVEPFKHKS